MTADPYHRSGLDACVPVDVSPRLFQGVAKITNASDGDGTYTVTIQIWNGSAWAATAVTRYVSAEARDYQASTEGEVDDYVRCWEQRKNDGTIELLIQVMTGGTGELPTGTNHYDLLRWNDTAEEWQVLLNGSAVTQYMVLQKKASGAGGEVGFDWPRFH